MKTTIQLESKDVRVIIAKFLGLKLEDVIPNRYSFSIASMSESEIRQKMGDTEDTE